MTIDMNVTGVGAAASFINCNSLNNITLGINAGRTLTLPTGGYIAVGSNSSSSDPTTGGQFYNQCKWYNHNYGTSGISNLANKPTFTTTLNVNNGGTVNMGGKITALATGTAGAINVIVKRWRHNSPKRRYNYRYVKSNNYNEWYI